MQTKIHKIQRLNQEVFLTLSTWIFQQKQSLKAFNTFGLAYQTDFFASFKSEDELKKLLVEQKPPLMVLGGGSNILLTQNFKGTVLKNEIKGIEIVEEMKNSYLL